MITTERNKVNWTFEGIIVENPPEKAYGFIYEITCTTSGRKYIGRKYLTFAKTKQVKKKTKKFRVESDWRDYWSSSPYLLEEMEKVGKENFKREILLWCYSRAECNYMELRYQFDRRVIESDDYYNSNIASKHFKRVVSKFPSIKT